MISWRMAAAWVAALVLATVLTWQIVGLADSQVGETPAAVAASVTSSSTETTATTPTTTPGTSSSSSSSTSSSEATSSSTSQAPASNWSVRTINSPGGTVVIRYRPNEVELQAATPFAGFGVEVDDDGPDRVRVEFESEDDQDFRIEARWEGGELSIEVDD